MKTFLKCLDITVVFFAFFFAFVALAAIFNLEFMLAALFAVIAAVLALTSEFLNALISEQTTYKGEL